MHISSAEESFGALEKQVQDAKMKTLTNLLTEIQERNQSASKYMEKHSEVYQKMLKQIRWSS